MRDRPPRLVGFIPLSRGTLARRKTTRPWQVSSRPVPSRGRGVLRKTREIYRFQGVQVHLDTVKGLGKFLEFEKVLADESERDEGRKHLEALQRYFQIPDEDLMASSYSDFLESE